MSLFVSAILTAFGTFSVLPVPCPGWGEKSLRYSLAALPLVGAAAGLLLFGWARLCAFLQPGGLVEAAGYCLLPQVFSGGFHLDGFADVSDARASWAEPARRRQILKDSHIGAFALIRTLWYTLALFALATALRPEPARLALLALLLVLERALGALALVSLPLAAGGGMARTFADGADRARVRLLLGFWAFCCLAGLLALGRLTGLAMALLAALCFLRLSRVSRRDFGGLSGDLAGWFIQRCELWGWAALILGQALAAKGVWGWF